LILPDTIPCKLELEGGHCLEIDGPLPSLPAKLDGRSLHSFRDPIHEAARSASAMAKGNPDCVILFGGGFGFLPEALLSALPEAKIVIVEPDQVFPAFAQKLRPSSPLWSNTRVHWYALAAVDDLSALVETRNASRPAYGSNPAVAAAWPQAHEQFRSAVDRIRFRRSVNVHTLKRFGGLWVRNLLRNLVPFALAGDLSLLKGRFQGIPALVIAGGPSLDDILPLLKDLQERFLLVAVDTSLRACLRAGVDPDLLVVMDPQYWNTRLMDGCCSSKAILVTEPSVYARAIRAITGPLVLSGSMFPLGAFLEEALLPRERLGAGGSVATSAWDLARMAGASEIVCAGLDLSFPESQTHFHGSFFEEMTHANSSRCSPAETERFRYLYDGGSSPCPSTHGSTVRSDQRMDLYAQWFEQQVRLYPDMLTRRIEANHRILQGISELPLSQVLAQKPCRERINLILDDVRQKCNSLLTGTESEARIAAVSVRLEVLAADLSRLLPSVTGAITTCENIQKAGRARDEDLAHLDAFDRELGAAKTRRIIGFLLEDVIQEIQTMPPPQTFNETIDRSHLLYTRLAESIHLQLRLVQSAVQR